MPGPNSCFLVVVLKFLILSGILILWFFEVSLPHSIEKQFLKTISRLHIKKGPNMVVLMPDNAGAWF